MLQHSRQGLCSVEPLEARTLLSQYGLVDSYGSHGILSTEFAGTWDFQEMLIVQLPDQTTLLAGTAMIPESDTIRGSQLNRIVMAKVDAAGNVIDQWMSSKVMAIVTGMAMQSDGKLVLSGVDNDATNLEVVARFTTTGALDTSFANAGELLLGQRQAAPFGSTGVVVDPQDRILILEHLSRGSLPRLISRLNRDGTTDARFGTGGTVQFGESPDFQVAFQSGGKILVADESSVRRITDAGTPDSSFGINGLASYGGSMLVLADGRILLNSRDKVIRLGANGALDRSFGANGIATVLQGITVRDPRSFIEPDGSITVLDVFGVAKLTADGQPDPDFGTSGRLNNYKNQLATAGMAVDSGADYVLASNGDALMSGYSTTYAGKIPSNILARLQAQPDIFLGANGWLSITGTDGGDSVVVTSSGDQVRVSLNGVVETFALADVHSVDILCGDGNNGIRIALPVPTTITSGAGNDTIVTGDADDSVEAGAGDDLILSNGGDDIVHAGPGRNTQRGGAGNDTLSSTGDGDSIDGGDGSDFLGSTGRATLDGGNGNDYLGSGSAAALAFGGSGFDVFVMGAGPDTIYGGDNNDRIFAGDGDNLVFAGPGNDDLHTGAGRDTIWGEIGYDSMHGGAGDDLMNGGAGKDRMWGMDGDDRLYGRNNNDALDGGTGNDRLIGGQGIDKLFGYDGDDRLYARDNDAETLDGGNGFDSCAWDDPLDVLLGVEHARA